MVRTRLGFSGGTTLDPSYNDLGDHSESIQIEYDPSLISYEELLQVFWDGHDYSSEAYSNQDQSIIFYHDDRQRELAEKSIEQLAEHDGGPIYTIIKPYSEFYLAEEEHQKNYLQLVPSLNNELRAYYPVFEDFMNSTAAARINGYIGGFGTLDRLNSEIELFGLSSDGNDDLKLWVR